jgi:hypothetical protein
MTQLAGGREAAELDRGDNRLPGVEDSTDLAHVWQRSILGS